MMKRTLVIEILILFICSLTPMLWLHGGQIVLGHDSNYRLNHLPHMVSSMFSWNDKSYWGNDWTYDRGYLPVNLIQLLLLWILPSFSAMQTVFFVLLFFVIGLSTYACVYGIFPETKYRGFRILAGLFSMYNFFILQGWFTADTGRFLIFAGLPLYILVIHKLFTGSWTLLRSAGIFAAVSFFFNGNGLPPLVGFQALAVLLIGAYYAVYKIRRTGLAGVWFSLKTAFVLLTVFLTINAYWILPIMNFTSASYTTDVSSSGGPEGVLAWERVISKYASFENLFRLQGLADWYENVSHAYSSPYIKNPFLILLSFIPVVTVACGLLFGFVRFLDREKRKFIECMLLLWIFGLFMSSGTHAPFGKIYELFIRYIPGFVIFRSSLYKFGFAVWIPAVLLFGFFVNEIQIWIQKKLRLPYVITVAAAVWILGFHYPYFLPEKIFHFTDVFKTSFILPGYVSSMARYIDTSVGNKARILLLPELDREFIGIPVDAYAWGYYSLNMLPNLVTDAAFIADKESDTILQQIYKSIYSGDTGTFSRLTKKAGITFVLFRSDIEQSPGARAAHPVEKVESQLQGLSVITLVRQEGRWRLYKIAGNDALPLVRPVQSLDVLESPVFNPSYLIARPDTPENRDFIRPFSDTLKQAVLNNSQLHIREAECFLCKKDEYADLVKSITLPKPKVLPDFITRDSVKTKTLFRLTADKPRERIDADLSVTLRMIPGGYSDGQAFRDTWTDAISNLSRISGRDKNWYAIRLVAYLDAERSFVGAETKAFLSGLQADVKKDAWYTEQANLLRFGIQIPTGTYTFYIPGRQSYGGTLVLDGIRVDPGSTASLTEGFHRIELSRDDINTDAAGNPPALFLQTRIGGTMQDPPNVSYAKINPVEYRVRVQNATGPFILLLNQRFDSRWKAYLAGTNSPVPDKFHAEINSYANGWYIEKTGDFDMTIFYSPQQVFYLGMMISGTACAIGICFLGYFIWGKYNK